MPPDAPQLPPAPFTRAHRRLDGWRADPAALFEWLRARVTSETLWSIARLDNLDHAKHLAALEQIAARGLIPQPLPWHPCEPLELARWQTGPAVDHLARAFACTVLVIDACGATYRDAMEPTIPILIESCLALGGEPTRLLLGLVVALAEAYEDGYTEVAFAFLGLLLVGAAIDPFDPRLPPLAAHIVAADDANDAAMVDPRSWLLGRTHFDTKHKLWRALAAKLLGPHPHLSFIAERLRRAPFGQIA